MKRLAWIGTACCLILLLAGCGGGEKDAAPATESTEQPADETGIQSAAARLEAKSGSTLRGKVLFTHEGGQVSMLLQVIDAPPGEHAVHLHEIGDCSAADGTSAGGHWNPTQQDHGKWGSPPHHLGDIGNLIVDDGGAGELALVTDRWTIRDGGPNDIIGRSVIVHAKADDFSTQPTGAAGGRIGCGVVAASR